MKKTYEQALKGLRPGETLYTYALYTDGGYDNDTASWFYDFDEAVEAGRKAIREDGIDPDCVAIMKFEDSSMPGASDECQWDHYVRFDEEARAWSEDWRQKMTYAKQSYAAQELAAHVTFAGVLFAACTARASVEPETRQRGVYVHAMGDESGYGDCVLFNGAELPANKEEAYALLKESADSTQECLDSIEFVR